MIAGVLITLALGGLRPPASHATASGLLVRVTHGWLLTTMLNRLGAHPTQIIVA